MICYIALGSNQDNPERHVSTAFDDLNTIPETGLLKRSKLYKTRPMGPINQPDFINAAACIDTKLDAFELMKQLKQLELQHDRKSNQQWGPRTLDLDLLLYHDQIIESDNLTVPHPGMLERDFVYIPLLEIAPDLVLPTGKKLKSATLSNENFIISECTIK